MTIGVKYYAGTRIYDITPLVQSVNWSGDMKEASRACQVSLNNTINGTTKAVNITNGADIRFYHDGKEKFRGNIFSTDVSSDGSFSFTARDYNHYLTKNKDSQRSVKKKASAIVKSIAQKHGIAVGHIDDTGYVIPKMILRDKTLDEIITTALTETRKKTGKYYVLANEAGKLTLRERRNQVKRLIIGDGRNLIGASYSESIEDLRNSVRLTGKSGEDVGGVTFSDAASIKKYGLMREKQHESDATDARLKPIATQLLKELNKLDRESNIEAFGDSSVYAGKTIQVSETMTGMNGGFFVVADSHTFSAEGTHTMSLKVSHWLEVDEIAYEPPEEAKPVLTALASGNKLDVVYQTGYIATAYAPALGGINRSKSGLTKSGTKVVEGRTIAVDPSVIPLGSVVAIYVASDKQYSGIYLAEDIGGAIKGKKIDIAVVASKAKAFGVKNIQVSVLERGKGTADARSKASRWSSIESKWAKQLAPSTSGGRTDSTVRSNVVKLANSYKGKLKYSFGGKNITGGTGDCSGFTYYIFQKAAGVNIGHGTSMQITKGTKISSSLAQTGDLVFFQGTYRSGVSHVGIVTRPGYFVGLGNSGCKEASYTSGYWAKHFMQIRRVLP